ncbi:4183_t:CDS:10 [Funneliformis mosseae]|uniref:Protection of telomeres protein 1 n=1 Tax=Funneliformis mosseae TaxID=27381 RepID=A0A9N9G4B7_FUNMO|nr:4183_t:CDS:10 [Funneliformis mosseae]
MSSVTYTVSHSDEEFSKTLRDENINTLRRPVKGFIFLQKARRPGALVNVIGVVVACTPKRKSNGTDYTCSLVIIDPSIPLNAKGITVNVFRSLIDQLPDLSVGNIFVGKNLRIQTFYETTQLVATKEGSTFKVIDDITERDHKFPFSMRPHAKEIMEYSGYLRRWCTSSSNSRHGDYTSITSSRKRIKIQELLPGIFFDLIAEIVMVCSAEFKVDLYVTDFTENKLLGNQEYRPKTPYGLCSRNILQITLWDEHVEDGEKLPIGTFVLLRNLHSKRNTNDDLVAFLHGDREFRNKKIIILDEQDAGVKEIISRRSAFCAQKTQKVLEPIERSSCPELEHDYTEQSITRIICGKEIELTEIDDIKVHPEPANFFRTRGRVISVMPPNFEDFSQPYCHRCNKIIHIKGCENCTKCSRGLKRFKYKFGLLFEDELGVGTLPVLITKGDANTFLEGLPPVNLYQNQTVLQKLKGRMQKLLGNVLESQAGCGPLIDFCVRTYEIEDENGNFKRIYRMFNTVLQE